MRLPDSAQIQSLPPSSTFSEPAFPPWIFIALFMDTEVLISGGDRCELLFPVRAFLKVSLGAKKKDEIKYSKQFD